MEPNSTYFIKLLSAFLHRHAPLQEKEIDWERVYRLGNIHFVSGMIYFTAKGLREGNRPPGHILHRMKQDFASTLARSAAQEEAMDGVIREFCKAELPHLLLKGYAIRGCYPVKELRTMGDIDFLIKREDRAKSHGLLLALGFKAGPANGNVWHYAKGKVSLEVHSELFFDNFNNRFDYIGYFSGAWEHAVREPNGFTHMFTSEYHLLYLLVHMAKHFHGHGCGIRMIMDIAAYVKQVEETLDWAWINGELEKLRLSLFASNVFGLCRRWFGTAIPMDEHSAMEETVYKEIGDYILSAGTFGFYRRNKYASIRRKFNDGHNGEEKKPAAGSYYSKFFFPSYRTLSNSSAYAFVRHRPYLVPVAWIYRFARNLIPRGRSPVRILLDIAGSKREYNRQADVMSKMGL